MFDSWQIVSSNVMIEELNLIAMSGRRESKMFDRGWTAASFRSTNNSALFFSLTDNQSAIIRSIRSCLALNRDSDISELQNESTCLFVWMPLQSEQLGEDDFPHRCKLAAVGSCCCNAIRTKRKNVSGNCSTNADQLLMFDLEKESVMIFCSVACIFRVFRCPR